MNYTAEQQKANRRKWVKALRSGEYEQTKRFLRYKGEYCCLGVACDISGVGKWGGDGETYYADGDFNNTDLPESVMNWLGLADISGHITDELSLTGLNDTGKTFAEIADVIEAEPSGLVRK